MKRKIWWLVGIPALGLVGLYAFLRPPALKMGKPPVAVEYFPADRVNAKPTIDLPLLGDARFTFPRPITVDGSPHAALNNGLAGVLTYEHPGTQAESGLLKVGDLEYSIHLSGQVEFVGSGLARGTAVPSQAMLHKRKLALPYATRAEFQKAQIQFTRGGPWTDVELPLSPEFTPPKLTPKTSQSGPYKITITPLPWRTTNAPYEFDIVIKAPEGKEFLIELAWLGGKPLVLKANQPTRFFHSYRYATDLSSVLQGVKPKAIECVWKVDPSTSRLELCYQPRPTDPVKPLFQTSIAQSHGYFRIGKEHLDPLTYARNGVIIRSGDRSTLDSMKAKPGDRLTLEALETVESHYATLLLSPPATPEMLALGKSLP